MRPNFRYFAPFLAAMALLTACQMTPSRKEYAAARILDTSNRLMVAAYDAGKVKQDAFDAYADAAAVAYEAIQDLEQARIEGREADMQTLSDAVAGEIERIIVIRINAIGK